MLPFIYETALIGEDIPTVSETAAGTNININGIPATIGQEYMKINPVFDWSPVVIANGTIGIPLWVFITAGFFLLLLYVFISWFIRIRRMSGVSGYVQAAAANNQEDMQVWIFGKTKKLTIECLKYWGGMIHYPVLTGKITKWRHPSISSTANIGGVTAVFASDDYDHTRDMISEIALTTAGETFNRNIDTIIAEARRMGQPEHVIARIKPISCFSDYERYGREVLGWIYPDGIPIKSYSIFDHTSFRKFFPKGRDGDFSGGVFLRKSRKLKPPRKDTGWFNKFGGIALCIIFVGLLLFAAMYAPIGK